MDKKINELNEQLATRTDYESDSYMQVIEEVSALSEKFYSLEEINYDGENKCQNYRREWKYYI